jgi:3D-(3,5/4)-trihydroxycyclohexane-1,2-dione acylhydrolase (decyclizing)
MTWRQPWSARAADRPRSSSRDRPGRSTAAGGAWWDVPVPEESPRAEVRAAHARYLAALRGRGTGASG